MRRAPLATVPVAVSATNRRLPAESMGWLTILMLVLVVAAAAAGVAAAMTM
jgi:hypothetical protein